MQINGHEVDLAKTAAMAGLALAVFNAERGGRSEAGVKKDVSAALADDGALSPVSRAVIRAKEAGLSAREVRLFVGQIFECTLEM